MARAFYILFITLFIAACTNKSNNEVVVYTSVDQVFSEPVLKEFEQQTGIKVNAVFDTEETKSTGVLNRLIAKNNTATKSKIVLLFIVLPIV
jgi:iron(III) transport system substrate-binding protein